MRCHLDNVIDDSENNDLPCNVLYNLFFVIQKRGSSCWHYLKKYMYEFEDSSSLDFGEVAL